MRVKRLGGWWIVSLLSLVTLGANSADRRVVEAAKNADTVALRALLKQGGDVNASQGDGTTALHWAAYWDDLETADLLIRAGATVNATNDIGVTPLRVACTNGSVAMIRALLKAGAGPNIGPATGGTPLMRAVRTGNAQAVQLLVNHGADVNAAEAAHGQTALMWAVVQHHPTVVQLLIEAGANVEARSTIWRQRVVICCQTFNGDANVDTIDEEEGGLTPLLFAAREGDLEGARLLLAAGADVNATDPVGATGLVAAARAGHGSIATLLLDYGADPNAAGAGYSALHAAVLRADLGLVNTLLAHGANPNARLVKGSPARRTSRDFAFNKSWVGATPFWLAAAFHESQIMPLLVTKGADPLLALKNGTTPLMAAAQGETPRAFSQLGTLSALLPGPNEERRTLEAVRAAVRLGADVNAADELGDTALHRVAEKKFGTVVQFLAETGAILDVTNKKGQTPLALAMQVRQLPKGSFGILQNFEIVADGGHTADLLRRMGAK